jgi:hypothetical protein
MASFSDDQKFIVAALETIPQFNKATYIETMSTMETTLGGLFTENDPSDLKSALPLEIWNRQPENILAAGGHRPVPADPAPGIPAGPAPIEPILPTQAEMNVANMQLSFYNARVSAYEKSNKAALRFNASKTAFKMAFLQRILAIQDLTTHTIVTNNRVTNLPDNTISLEDILLNFTEHFSVPNDAAKDQWQSTFDRVRTLDQPFKEFIATWTVARTKLNGTDRICTDFNLMAKFTEATSHDPRVREFMVELRRLHPGSSQTWAQMMALAAIQDANLDGDIKLVHSAMGTTTTTPTIAAGGGATVATNAGGGATGAAKTYCFIHGKAGHNSMDCKMIKLNAKAYPYDISKIETFTTNAQVDQAKLAKSPKFEVKGIGKGNAK